MNPDIEWSTREKLAIASYVLRSGEQHWSGVGRLLRPLGEQDRPSAWFSPKFCAQQYTALLENEKLPKRKRNTERSDSSENPQTPISMEEMIVRRLTKERIEELKKQLRSERSQYRKVKHEMEMVESGALDDKLDDILQDIENQNKVEKEQSENKNQTELSILSPETATSGYATENTDSAVADSIDIEQQMLSVAEEMRNEIEKLNIPLSMKKTQKDISQTPEESETTQHEEASHSTEKTSVKMEENESHKESKVSAGTESQPPVTSVQEMETSSQETTESLSTTATNEVISYSEGHQDGLASETNAPFLDSIPPDSQQDNKTCVDEASENEATQPVMNEEPQGQRSYSRQTDKADLPEDKLSCETESALEQKDGKVAEFGETEEENANNEEQNEDEAEAEKEETKLESLHDEDSRSSADEQNVDDASDVPKNSAVEDNSCPEIMEENESVYNYSMDEETQGYQQSNSLPGTPGPYGNFTCDSFPSSPALSHSSDMDPDAAANWKAWRKSIMILWKQVASHRYASLFLQPVTDDIAPNYSTTVYRCMDLSSLKKNIENGTIRTTSEFQRDLMLMFQNAIMYNNREHDVYKMTMEMQKDVMDQVAQFLATQLMVETAQPTANKSLRRSTMRRSAMSEKVSEARSKRVAAIEGEAKFMRKKQPSHE